MPIVHVTSKEQYQEAIEKNSKVVVNFYATWCGPCRMISPKVEEFSNKYTNIAFFEVWTQDVDVDELEAMSKEEGIEAMPTFKFYKNGSKAGEEMLGASPDRLEDNLKKLCHIDKSKKL